ncbi:splicing factor 3B subunit 5/RDS3 complex subunit 10, partial [Gorgonomyces haynaldii]
VQSKYVGTGNADTDKFQWLQHHQRDSLASYLGHNTLYTYMAVAENESIARIKYRSMERMLRPCGPRIPRDDD